MTLTGDQPSNQVNPYPSKATVRTVQDRIAEHARQSPDSIAVTDGDKQLSYHQLNDLAEKLAVRLKQRGVDVNTVAAIQTAPSIEMVVCLLAILKAEGCYLPIDPSTPAQRAQFVINDSEPVVLITDDPNRAIEHRNILSVYKEIDEATRPCTISSGKEVATPPETVSADGKQQNRRKGLEGQIDSSDRPAYIIYTSGTTGEPKGCIATQTNVMGLLASAQEYFGFNRSDIWTLFHSFAFDFSVWEIWGALSFGGRLVIVPEITRRDPQAMVALLEREQVTVLNQTPTAFSQLLQVKRLYENNKLSLRYVIFGGEGLNIQTLKPWLNHHGDDSPQLINMYGITETTVHVTLRRIHRSDLANKKDDREGNTSISSNQADSGSIIGKPLAGAEIYLLDDDLQLVDDGEIGEIMVGGWGVTRGYLNREELTAERFITKPGNGCRLYRSGDLGKRLPNGELVYLGRIDQQVKLRGYRIELGEIEAVMLHHPSISRTCVICQEVGDGEPMLVAYYVANHDTEEKLKQQRLREFIATRLPGYMVPGAFVELESLPLTVNGKLDRNALPPASLARTSETPNRSLPIEQGEREQLLTALWCDLLGLDQVQLTDNFFELGGHSLLAIQLQARLAEAEIEIDIASLFANPTIAELAPTLRTASGCIELELISLDPEEIRRVHAAIPGGASNIEDIYPLTPLQEGLLFHHRMGLASAESRDPYLSTTAWSFQNRKLLDRFVDAFKAIVDRHPILRTAFLWEGLQQPLQVVCREVPIQLEEICLNAEHGEIIDQLKTRVTSLHSPIDPSRAPLIRFLIAADPAQHRWLLMRLQHHLISDHVSEGLINSELQAHLRGKAKELPPAVPFRTVVEETLQTLSKSAPQHHFTDLLSDLNEATLPFELARISASALQGKVQQMQCVQSQLSKTAVKRLKTAARLHGVSPASLCHLAWALVLARGSNRSDVCFGTVLLGRLQGSDALSRSVGPCINTLPLRVRLLDASVAETAQQMQSQLNNLIRHEHTSLALAQRCSGIASPAPLFHALLNFRFNGASEGHFTDSSLQIPGIIELCNQEEYTHYPLLLSIDDRGNAVELSLQAREPIEPERVLGAMATALDNLSEALIHRPTTPIQELEVLPCAERRMVLQDWNQTQRLYPAGYRIDTLFAQQVRNTPTAIAVETSEGALSYSELNDLADQLAIRLRGQAVDHETIVGVALERGSALVVALLGILKAGGAYLPIDPTLPRARRAVLLEEAGCSLLLEYPEQVLSPTGKATEMGAFSPASGDPGIKEAQTSLRNPGRQLAYISFTSGSTGTPKGVAVEHRSVNRLVINNQALEFAAGERVLQLAPLSFDAATLEIWGPLLNGGTLVLHPPQQPSTRELATFVVEKRITTMWLTAGLFHLMVDEQPKALRQVRQLLAGGDRLSTDHVRRLLSGLPDGHVLINGYGPTENTTFTCCHRMHNRTVIKGSVPIGRPISNTTVYVLNEARQPLPVGVVGELYIGGDGLARGYLHQPEKTAERFIHDAALGRLYRSGDLVSWNQEAELQFHGRNDNQIKLRGFRIELDEIEASLQMLPTVAQALVLCQSDETGDKQLVGYVVANEDEAEGGSGIDGTTLRQQLNAILPNYMVPSWIMVMEEFPINPNGKVDRSALPKPGKARSGKASTLGFTKSDPIDEHFHLDPLGALVLEVWSEVLGCTVFGADDNFFELGGHSLAAAHVVARLEKRLPTRLSPADLFRYPTPRLLKERLRESEDKDPNNPMVTLREGSEGPPLFVIHGMFGDVFGFVDFARCMPEGQQIYGVQMPRAQVGNKAASVESLASLYGDWIRKIQPEGPYHLIAGSAGGWFAYAVAAALQREGLRIRRLILLDTLANPILGKTQRLRMLGAYGRQRLTPELSGSIAGSSALNNLQYILGPKWRRQGLLERFGRLARPWVDKHNTDYSLELVRRYRPPRLNLELDLLTPLPTQHWSLSFWDSVVTGEVRIHNQFSRHADFFAREHAQALAITVQALLNDKEPQAA